MVATSPTLTGISLLGIRTKSLVSLPYLFIDY